MLPHREELRVSWISRCVYASRVQNVQGRRSQQDLQHMEKLRVGTLGDEKPKSDLLEKADVSLFSSDQKEEFSEAGSLRKELRDEHFHQTMFRDGLKEGLEEACH